MASAQEQSAAYTVRSSISSLWTSRRKKHNPLSEQTSQPASTQNGAPAEKVVKAGFSALQKNGAGGPLKAGKKGGRETGRHGDEEPRKRDDEAEVWGFEASMGVGAGREVKKEDREEILRGRILGKRRWEDANAKEKEGKGKADEGDSDEDVGRSALGRKKRAPRVEAPRPKKQVQKDVEGEREVENNGAGADTEMKDAGEKTEEKAETVEEKGSEGIENSTPADYTPSGESKKQKKKKNKKKRKAEAE